MGTISPPFILCPLSDRKELLGMSEDKLQNKVIITIGRNIAIRYYVLEQKQERSWTISQHWLTSKVVYCPEFEKYGAVIDNNIVGLWDEEDTAVNRFKIKLKFNQPVLELKPTRTLGTLVVFENGFVCVISKLRAIQDTLKQKEFKGVIDDLTKESIVDVVVNEAEGQVILVVGHSQKKDQMNSRNAQQRKSLKIIVVKLQLGYYDEEVAEEPTCDVVARITIKTKKKSKAGRILGHCVIPGATNSVVYIDSDGKLLEKKCIMKANQNDNSYEEIGSVADHVSLKTPVVMRYIEDGSALVIYGSDPSEEGAVVFLYDLKYDVLIARQSLKLYGTPPIMEKIGRNVIVPVGLHILVLGVNITKSVLSAVVGKHRLKPGEEVFEQRNPWPTGPTGWELDNNEISAEKMQKSKQKKIKGPEHELGLIKKSFPECWEYVNQFKTLEKEGQPESVICDLIIPAILGNDNIPALDWILDAVTDIPENLLVQILSFLLKIKQDPLLNRLCSSESKENRSNEEQQQNGTSLVPDERINRILFRDFDQNELVRALPSMGFEQVRYFIQYLKFMMDYDWPVTEVEPRRRTSEVGLQLNASCWIKWISCVLNAHYTKFVINSEIDLVENMLVALEERTKLFDAIEEFGPYFLMTYNKVNFEPRPNPNSKWRSEVITFV